MARRVLSTAIVLSALVTGCSTEVAEVGPRTWEGDFLIDEAVIDCDDRSWRYDVRTQGWGEEITVQIVVRKLDRLVWSEAHVIEEVDHGEDWARFAVELDVAETEEAFAASASTRIACEAKTLVTYGFAAWHYGGELSECIGWGIDPEREFPDCASWGQVDH